MFTVARILTTCRVTAYRCFVVSPMSSARPAARRHGPGHAN